MQEEMKTDSTLSQSELDLQAIAMIKASGILNPNSTLENIMDLSMKIVPLKAAPKFAKHTDTFIHSHFVYSHEES